jgi:hypothetical protein
VSAASLRRLRLRVRLRASLGPQRGEHHERDRQARRHARRGDDERDVMAADERVSAPQPRSAGACVRPVAIAPSAAGPIALETYDQRVMETSPASPGPLGLLARLSRVVYRRALDGLAVLAPLSAEEPLLARVLGRVSAPA